MNASFSGSQHAAPVLYHFDACLRAYGGERLDAKCTAQVNLIEMSSYLQDMIRDEPLADSVLKGDVPRSEYRAPARKDD